MITLGPQKKQESTEQDHPRAQVEEVGVVQKEESEGDIRRFKDSTNLLQ